MKADKIYITIEFDNVPGAYDYPQNVPLPKIGETVLFDSIDLHRSMSGTVYDVRHNFCRGLHMITIKSK